MKKLVIIDGKSVFYRGYYAMSTLSTADGIPTGGVYGFIMLAFEVIKKLHDYVVVAWDKKGTSTSRRTAIYPSINPVAKNRQKISLRKSQSW